MLSDEVYEKVVKIITDRIDKLNTFIIEQIGESINKLNELTPSKAYQLINALKYGGDYKKIVKEISRITKLNVKDIDEIFEEVAKSDYRFAKQFYDYRNIGYIPYEENEILKNEIDTIKRITEETFLNLSKTSMLGYGIRDKNGKIVYKTIKDIYYKVLDEKVLSITQGRETFSEAYKNLIEDIGESGLKTFYESGYARRLDSTVRMDILDGIHQVHNKGQEIMGEQFGADGIEVTAHPNPAEDHELLQGRQFSFEEYDKLNKGLRAVAYDGTVIEANDKRRPISTMNCKHYEYQIVLGVSRTMYTKEQLDKFIEDNNKGFEYEGKHYTNYEGTQMQRNLELKIRQEQDKIDMATKANDEDLDSIIQKSNGKIKLYKKKRRELQKLIYGGN